MTPKNLHLKKMACPESHQYIDRETTQVKTENLWKPSMIFFLQFLWAFVFIYTGKSQVTGSRISFHVIRDKI
jgi:hypothetical protein